MSLRTLRFFDVSVNVIDVLFDLEGIDRVCQNEHDADIDERHPEVAREEPSGDKAEQHYDSREDKIFDNIADDDREIQELIEKEIHDRYDQRKSEQQQYKPDLGRDSRPDYRAGENSEYHQRRKYASVLKYLSHGNPLEPPLYVMQIFARDYEPFAVIKSCLEVAVLELADARKVRSVHDAGSGDPDEVRILRDLIDLRH